ncbi:MAG TPA: peptidoglycan DD-metalloendopeptidase family protein [Thermodesulfobacteriota bacterium]|nr:peptidoglycan DD-metalloendopeptidase family protein [Thermodesulfobacteriota bacterium]
MKRWEWRLIGLLFLGWVFNPWMANLCAGRADPIEKDITQKRKDLKDIRKELNLTKEKEKQIRGKESSVLENLSQIDNALYQKEKELKGMEARLSQTRENLQQTKHQVQLLNKEMEQTKEEFFSRLIALYKMGRVLPETFLFTSQSYPDLLKIDKFLRVIIDFDARLVDRFRSQVSLKERYQGTLMKDQSQSERSIAEVEKKREEIKKVKTTKRALLKSIQGQKVVYQKVIGELEERVKDLQALIDRLEREKKTTAYGKSKPEVSKGKLSPPVHGNVISLFKERGQNGIEIKAPLGTEIRAVLPGKVLYADWFKGFGNVMIIDHGDQTFTVSGYCSQLLKKVGDVVAQGESVALVGSAGSLKGPCLYFEIRYKGKPQNPMEWLSHLEKVASLPEGNERGKKGL